MYADYLEISLTRTGSDGAYTYNWQNLPIPAQDSGGIEIQTNVDGGRNAMGNFIGQVIGDDKIKLNLTFPPLTNAEFHTLLAFFDRSQGGAFTFWVRFYDPRVDAKVIKHMYIGDRMGDPFRVQSTTTGKPDYWLNVQANMVEV